MLKVFRGSLPLAAALTLSFELMLPAVPGVADNGDFGKLLGRFRLGSGQTFVYANTKLRFEDRFGYHSGFNSSELLFIWPALALNRLVSRDGGFDIRVMGAVHTSVFVVGMWLLTGVLENIVLGVMALLLFSDFMYVGYFHSFYMDSAAFLFILLSGVFYLRAIRRERWADSAGLLVCLILATTASPHYAIVGIAGAELFWVSRQALCGGRKTVAGATAAVLIAASLVSVRYLAPEEYSALASYNVIFSQILPNTRQPDQALRELGLDVSYRHWIGTEAYTPGVPMHDPGFPSLFQQMTGYPRIVRFYVKHPGDAWRALRMSLDIAGAFRSPLGNFDSGSGKPPAAHYWGFQLVSGTKRRLFAGHGGRLLVYCAALALATPLLLGRSARQLPRGSVAGAAMLAVTAIVCLVFSSLADVYDQFRHQVVSFALFDMLLLTAIAAGLRRRPRLSDEACETMERHVCPSR